MLATIGAVISSPRGDAPAGNPSNTSAVPSRIRGCSGAGLLGPRRDPAGAGTGLLGVGRPDLDLGAVHVAGQDRPLVGGHLGRHAERHPEDCRVPVSVADGQRVERRPPPVFEGRLSAGTLSGFWSATTIVSAVITRPVSPSDGDWQWQTLIHDLRCCS